ncbi:MAG: hypothetical protein KJ558_14910 [Gammaproteobacteria bacterium]|nr:hypothetical protein [Gammaproteobacteria bacterium]MBU1656078.1 hypothetical protein [Gammaproteobacteria bacterium]MBU1960347.1 hypothetical protein [Gammaproteobacteria bacterium]
MASTPEELSLGYSEDGVELIKELDKVILTRGAWTTILFRYQDWDRAKNDFGPEKYSIRRYQKRGGDYLPKSKFNISSKDQAKAIVAALNQWLGDD